MSGHDRGFALVDAVGCAKVCIQEFNTFCAFKRNPVPNRSLVFVFSVCAMQAEVKCGFREAKI
ncbi:MAG: hypothetical protein CBE00_06255 [Planctomycetaceae bacterium TMED240]|nr:hypothetical protein [Rhodopirellula sp.]OUX06956.1 MAG: hypothetical protein CBE00_06255 [Planctomycetaceae bacterium TMED240]